MDANGGWQIGVYTCFRINGKILKLHLHKDFAESSQRLVETRVQQKALNVRDVPGVSASMIRMFVWPLQCLEGSSSELTIACSKLDRHLCAGCSLGALEIGLRLASFSK